MDIPAEVAVRVCIEQGLVYLCHIERINSDGTQYSGDRFFIVLNKNPKTDAVIVSVTITKQVEHQREYIRRIGEDPITLVAISKTDFPRLSIDSIVNCNGIYETTMLELVEDIQNGGKIFFEKLPQTIVSALVAGVMKSNLVSPEHKKLLL